MTTRILASLFALSIASLASGASQWTLTTADFHPQSATINSIDAAGIHFVPTAGGDEKVLPFNQFLSLDRPLIGGQVAGKFILDLVSEDHIGGEPAGIKGNDLLWVSPTLGEIALPMKQLVAMTRPGGHLPDMRRREDIVTLANGDTLRGIIANFANGKVTVQTDAGNSEVPIASISEIDFAIAAGSMAAKIGFRVRFDDGSSVVAESITVAGDKLQLSFGKNVSHSIELARVASIEQVNGPVSWLPSRPASESLYIPFIGSPRNNVAKMNHNWTGLDPIRFGSQTFSHGIGVHSYSRLSWDLDGQYEAFRTRYAIDTKDANTKADVTVRILLDGKAVYEQTHVRTGAISPVIVQDLKSAKKLTLEVDYGDNMDTQDRLNWIEPALLKHKPAE